MAVPTQISFAGVPNLALDATLTATNSATGHAPSKLQNGSLYETCESTGLTSNWQLVANMGAAVAPRAFIIAGTNLTNAATVKLESASDSGFSVSLTDHGTTTPFGSLLSVNVSHTPPWGRHVVILLASVPTARQYWRYTVNDAGNPDGKYTFGVLLMSQLVTPAIGALPVEIAPVMSDVTHVDLAWRIMTAQYGWLSENERSDFVNLAMEYGRTGRFFVIMRPARSDAFPDEALYCTLGGVRSSHRRGSSPVSASMTFEEVFD